MRRRGIGIGAVRRKQEIQQQYEDKGNELAASSALHAQEQLKEFKANLEAFSVKHKKSIKKDPEFRKVRHYSVYINHTDNAVAFPSDVY